MKKLLGIFFSVALVACLAGCGNNGTASTEDSGNAAATNEATGEDSSAVEVDENLLTVEVTLPVTYFEDMTEDEILNAASGNGYSSAVVNEDGSVTYTMTKAKWREALAEYEVSVDETIDSLLNGDEAVASFMEITRNADMSEFTVKVDSATYTEWDSFYALAFYFAGNYYQILNGGDPDTVHTVVNFVDVETGEILNTGDSANTGE